MEQSAGQCGGYRYIPSRRPRTKTLRSIKNKKGGRARKTRRRRN
jgi:hypothetical protein